MSAVRGTLPRRQAPSELAPLALLVLAFAAGALLSPRFLDAEYLLDASVLYVETALLALGMTFVIVSGNIDLSVASNLALTACLVAMLAQAGLPPVAVCLLGVAIGAGLGAINGALVAFARLPSFVASLATMAIFRGAAQILLGNKSIPLPEALSGVDRVGAAGTNVPISLVALIAVAALFGIVLRRSAFGRWVYALGGNEGAAAYAGLPVARTKLLVFTLTGALCGLAALHLDSRLGVARHDLAKGLELDAITAVVLGGASIFGGKGTILGTMLAVFLVAILRIGMGLGNVKAEYQLTAVGALLILAVVSTNLQAAWRQRRSR